MDRQHPRDLKPLISLLWEGTLFGEGSYSKVNQEICHRLARFDTIDLTSLPYEVADSSGCFTRYPELKRYDIRNKGLNLRQIRTLPSICVRNRWPLQDSPPPKGLKWVIYLPWEYSVLPISLSDILFRASAVWTMSSFCLNSFIRSGLDPNKVSIVPLGVDADLYNPSGSLLPLNTQKSFKLLFVGGTIYRKGIDILLDAYQSAFSPQDDICLVIKDFGTDSLYRGQTYQSAIRSYQTNLSNPELLYIDTEFDEEQMAALYRSCDVLVSSYRGEGFNLPALEAMASGLPVITTMGGPTDDFCDNETGWKIESIRQSIGHQIYGMETREEAWLLSPSMGHLKSLLGKAFRSKDEIQKKGENARKKAKDWSWDRCTEVILDRLQGLCGVNLL